MSPILDHTPGTQGSRSSFSKFPELTSSPALASFFLRSFSLEDRMCHQYVTIGLSEAQDNWLQCACGREEVERAYEHNSSICWFTGSLMGQAGALNRLKPWSYSECHHVPCRMLSNLRLVNVNQVSQIIIKVFFFFFQSWKIEIFYLNQRRESN